MRVDAQEITLAQSNDRIAQPRKLRGVASNHFQYRLDIGGRFGDDPQDVIAGGFALKRLGDLGVLLLHFIEELGIFEGGAHAVGQGLEQAHIRWAERVLALHIPQNDQAASLMSGHQWHKYR